MKSKYGNAALKSYIGSKQFNDYISRGFDFVSQTTSVAIDYVIGVFR